MNAPDRPDEPSPDPTPPGDANGAEHDKLGDQWLDAYYRNRLKEVGLIPVREPDDPWWPEREGDPPDLDLLRQYYALELDPKRAGEVELRIAHFRSWNDAANEVLLRAFREEGEGFESIEGN